MRVFKSFLGLLAAVSLVVGLGACSSADRGLERLKAELVEVGPPIVDAVAYFTISGLTRVLNVKLTIDSEHVGSDTLEKVFNIVSDAKLKKYVTMNFYLRRAAGEKIDILPEEVEFTGIDLNYLKVGTFSPSKAVFDKAMERMRQG